MRKVLNAENAIEDVNRLRRNNWRRMGIKCQFNIAINTNCIANCIKIWDDMERANDRNIGVYGLMIIGQFDKFTFGFAAAFHLFITTNTAF